MLINFTLLFSKLFYTTGPWRLVQMLEQGILKGGSITALLTSCLTGLESAVCQVTIFFCKTY
jgi:hypothetical protein